MNILTVCHFGLYRDLSDSFVHAQMREYARLGHRVRVLIPIALGKADWNGSRTAADLWSADGVELIPVRYLSLSGYGERSFNTRSALWALRCALKRLLDGFDPDVIHAHTLGFDSEIGAWLKSRLHCPLVVTTHGSDTADLLERGEKSRLQAFCNKADRIVAVSSVLGRKVESCGTAAPVTSILNGFALQHLPEDADKQPLSFIQVGNLTTQKRFSVTIQAFARICQRYADATLTVIGSGSEEQALKALCAELGIAHRVRFLGQVPNREVLAEMAKAQFFVMPSVNEGFGIVYLEAMACGCITIGTEGEGISDLIRSGENGFLVPADDPEAIAAAVQRCIDDAQLAEAIARSGSDAARQLTWAANADAYLTLFTQLIATSSKGVS